MPLRHARWRRRRGRSSPSDLSCVLLNLGRQQLQPPLVAVSGYVFLDTPNVDDARSVGDLDDRLIGGALTENEGADDAGPSFEDGPVSRGQRPLDSPPELLGRGGGWRGHGDRRGELVRATGQSHHDERDRDGGPSQHAGAHGRQDIANSGRRSFVLLTCPQTPVNRLVGYAPHRLSMSIRVALTHTTRYRYDRAVTLAPHVVRLRPAPHCRTSIPSYSLRIKPEEHFLNWQQDPFGNHQARLAFPRPARELTVEVDLIAEMVDDQPVRLLRRGATPRSTRSRTSRRWPRELAPYREPVVAGPRAGGADRRAARRASRAPGGATSTCWSTSTASCRSALRYDIRMEPGVFAARGDAGARPRVVPRLRLAGGRAAAPPRLRRALRVGLLDPAQARRRRRRRPVGRQRGRRRSARLDRGLPARRRLDRPRRHQRPARGGGAHPARLHRAAVDGGADLGFVFVWARARDDEPQGRRGVHLRDEGAPHRRDAAGHRSRTATISGRRSRRSGGRSTAIWNGSTFA